MDRFESFASVSLFLGLGIVIFLNWRYLVQGAIDSGDAVWGRLGVPQASEKIRRLLGEILFKFVGGVFVLAGGLMLYSALTGRDWPLHYARWEDLWPF